MNRVRKKICPIVLGIGLAWGWLAASVLASDGIFEAPTLVLDHQQRLELMLDMDGIGPPEFIDWWYVDSDREAINLTGWKVDGQGDLQSFFTRERDSFGGEITTYASAKARIDLDGWEDFALAFNDQIDVWISRGTNIGPRLATRMTAADDVHELALGDFDGDGDGDLAMLGGPSAAIHLMVYRNDNETFTLTETYLLGTGAHGLETAEVNGDSVSDLVVLVGNEVRLLTMSGNQVSSETSHLHGLPNPMAAVGDIDGDLDQDVVVFDMAETYVLLRRDSPTTFNVEAERPGGPATDLYDVDGDGDADGVCCGGGGGTPLERNDQPSDFRIAHNDGQGGFAVAMTLPGLGAEHLAGVADLDRDGDRELIAGRVIYYPSAPLTEDPRPPLPQPLLGDRGVADFDGDGDFDLDLGFGTVIQNSADGTFSQSTPVFPSPPAGTLFEGPGFPVDYDDDGDLDLIVSCLDPTGAFLSMRKLRNAGGGSFTDDGNAAADGVDFNVQPPGSPERNSAYHCLPGDIDGDGDTDLFVMNPTTPESQAWINDGSGVFEPGVFLAEENVRWIGDLNHDPYPDVIVVANFTKWRLGVGEGLFNDARYLILTRTNAMLDQIAVTDIDGDGWTDVAALDADDGGLIIYTNDRQGSFRGETFSSGYSRDDDEARRVWARDVDGDGELEILASPVAYTRGRVLGIYDNGQESYQLVAPTALCDVDGDGDQDALSTHVHPNVVYRAPDDGARRQYGVGYPGLGGVTPNLGADGPFRPGEAAALKITGTAPESYTMLVVGTEETALEDFPKTGMVGYVFPWLFLQVHFVVGQPGVPGSGSLNLPYPVPELFGLSIFHQVFVFDAGSPTGVSSTGGLEIHYP